MYDRISTVVNNFKDVSKLSEIEIASLARRDGIDIAIDLSGLHYKRQTTDFRT